MTPPSTPVPAATTDSPRPLEVVVVEVVGHRCGLLVADVLELHAMVAVTPLPDGPDIVDGVVDYRGAVVAVLDLAARFGLPRRPPRVGDHLVVARAGPRVVALRVDRAVALVAIPVSAVETATGLPGAERLVGVARMADGLVLIHDLPSFLSEGEAGRLDAALSATTEHPTA